MTNIPTLVRSARMALGLTQKALGEQIGYTGRNAKQNSKRPWPTSTINLQHSKTQAEPGG
jgi:hypothetical protein